MLSTHLKNHLPYSTTLVGKKGTEHVQLNNQPHSKKKG